MWKQKKKIQPCPQGKVKPNAVRRTFGILRPSFASIISSSPVSPSNKETRTHQVEIEQRRSMATKYARHNTLR